MVPSSAMSRALCVFSTVRENSSISAADTIFLTWLDHNLYYYRRYVSLLVGGTILPYGSLPERYYLLMGLVYGKGFRGV